MWSPSAGSCLCAIPCLRSPYSNRFLREMLRLHQNGQIGSSRSPLVFSDDQGKHKKQRRFKRIDHRISRLLAGQPIHGCRQLARLHQRWQQAA